MRQLRILGLLALALPLGGCNFVVLFPSGDIALQQRDILVLSTVLMLLIIIPVMVLTVVFAWRYRAKNRAANYDPDWDHSTSLELVIWAAPLLIIICLGAVTWMSTHLLDPFRPIDRISADKPILSVSTPLKVDVVALDWKWLFIYPQYGIASVNEMAAPVNRPIEFHITSSTVMNAFYVPALAGMIYAMPAMETTLNAVINKPGTYDGFSSNYSGAGFSGMRFAFHGLAGDDFNQWIDRVRAGGGSLTKPAYMDLAKPSQNEPVRHFAKVDPKLFQSVVELCVEPGKMCMSEMSAIDARGGLGLAGINNVAPRATAVSDRYRHGAVLGGDVAYVTGICSVDEGREAARAMLAPPPAAPPDVQPVLGAGLPRPGTIPIRPGTIPIRMETRATGGAAPRPSNS